MSEDELATYKCCAALLREREALPWWAAIRYHRLTLRMRELLESLEAK